MEFVKKYLKKVPSAVPIVRLLKGQPPVYGPPREWVLKNIASGSVGAEVGVYRGEFAKEIISKCSPYRLHLIDPWEYVKDYENSWYGGGQMSQKKMDEKYDFVIDRFKEKIENGEVVVHRKRSNEAAEEFDDEYFDWVYIDGNHMYEFVIEDLKLFWPKVKEKGIIMGDDYGREGWWNNGVTKAVDEFVSNRDINFRSFGDQYIIG